ncbi:MAG: SDR family oxidoreductase [Spirochaetia bacterium]
MITIDYTGKSVLITGGTKGIGKAAALNFASAGARTYLTYKWGSADESALFDEFRQTGGPEPVLIQADVSVEEDTKALFSKIAETEKKLNVFISNVGFASTPQSLKDYKKRSLFKTLEYSTWPLIDYTLMIEKTFNAYPDYILGISSDGPDHFYKGYDYVAASKALLEFFSKYLSAHLFDENCKVNVIRFGTVKTESFDAVFGNDFFEYLKSEGISSERILTPAECGKTIFGICSGFMDTVNGQIITADRGITYMDNTMRRYQRWKEEKGQ